MSRQKKISWSVLMISCCYNMNSCSDSQSAVLSWWSAVAITGTADPTASQLFCPDNQLLPQKEQLIRQPIRLFCPDDQLLPQKEQLIRQPISCSVLMISCCHNRNNWSDSKSAVLSWLSDVATKETADPKANQLFCPNDQLLPQNKRWSYSQSAVLS